MVINEISGAVIGAAIEVHRELGPGKQEPIYQKALARELSLRGIHQETEKAIPVIYKGAKLDCGFRVDVLAAHQVVIETKSVELLHPIHRAQLITYLKLGGWRVGLLLNFNVAFLKEGIERFVLGRDDDRSSWRIEQDTRNSMAGSKELDVGHHCGDAEAEELARELLGAAIEVHRVLGRGLLPSVYEACLCHELSLRRVPFVNRKQVRIEYRGQWMNYPAEVNLVVGDRIAVTPCAVRSVQPVHIAEVLSHLRLGGWRLGFLLNFNAETMSRGTFRLASRK